MSASGNCERARALAPELALGIADGRERAEALAHIADCAACRGYLAEFTDVADELLDLAPAQEPPPGFETRVLAGLGIAPKRRTWFSRASRRPRHLLLAAAAAAACLLGVVATTSALLYAAQDERELAGQYRAALERVGGEYFQAARLRDGRGSPVGQVFGYQGRPSWLFVVVYTPFRDTPLTGTLTTRDGRTIDLGELELDRERGTWGGEIPVDLRDVDLVRLVGGDGRVYRSRIPRGPDD